jgi:hypothetical protein
MPGEVSVTSPTDSAYETKPPEEDIRIVSLSSTSHMISIYQREDLSICTEVASGCRNSL